MLNVWWRIGRSIPASRSGVRAALETLEITSTKMLLFCCYVLDVEETEEYMDEMSICDNSGCDTVTAFLLFPGKFVDMALRVG